MTIAAVNGQGNPAAWRPRFRVETAGAVLSARGRHYGVGHPGCSGDGAGRAVEKPYPGRAVGAVDPGVFRYLAGRDQLLAVPGAILFGSAGETFTCQHCAPHRRSLVALSAGFNDISHFNRTFRRAFGMSPRQ